jgi:hypothetical protein
MRGRGLFGFAQHDDELAWLIEVSAVVVAIVGLWSALNGAAGPVGQASVQWEVDVGGLDGAAGRLVREAFAALPDIERTMDTPTGPVAALAPTPRRLADDFVAPFLPVSGAPLLRFARCLDGDTVAYVGRATSTASPLGALVIIVQPTPSLPDGRSDAQHHRLASGHAVHASVWILPQGRGLAGDDSIDDAGNSLRPAGAVATAPLSLGLLRVRAMSTTSAP